MSNKQFILMSEYGGMDDWGLQAVVRGFTNEYNYSTTTTMDNDPESCFVDPLGMQQEGLLFPSPDHFFETTRVLDELEELYKPFYPVMHPLSPQTILTTSSNSVVPTQVLKEQSQELQFAGSAVAAPPPPPPPPPRAAKPKRRKNQNRKVVHQTADDLSSDMWAWRKYGQKPIKGSPYPRSYYRCSSSKGCPARKQVERSSSDPAILIITYTAEHSHTHPTRRSSLAGSTRKKSYSAPKRPTTTPEVKHSCSSPTTVLSPTTPLMACVEDDQFLQYATKREIEQQQLIQDENDNEAVIADLISNSDLFPSIEELDRLTSDMAFDPWLFDQIPAAFPC